MYYGLFKHVLLGPGLKAVYRPEAEGTENVPDRGGAILASNHLSFADHTFMPLTIKRKVTYMAKAEYFTGRGVKGYATKSFFEGVGAIPVHRAGGRASEAALRTGLQVIANGGLLGIFLEGTRSPDGRLYRGKTGAARIAIESGAPVIPVGITGTDIAQPTGQRVPSRHPILIKFGEPIRLTAYAGRQNDREALREATDHIMKAIQELTGQEYVDRDAALVKRELEQERRQAEREAAGE